MPSPRPDPWRVAALALGLLSSLPASAVELHLDAAAWQVGTTPEQRMASFDKQFVRDWLATNWDKTGAPPELPEEIVNGTAARYRELLQRLTG